MTPSPFIQTAWRNGIARHVFGVVIAGVLVLLAACAMPPKQATFGDAEPRPIGVQENASPDERGREILRVVVALVKHGDLADTDFASRLLRLPITPGRGYLSVNQRPFPQNLASLFGYSFSDVGVARQSVRFDLTSSEVCLRFDEFLTAFNKEFGIGTEIFKDNRTPPPRLVPPEQGWKEKNHIHPTRTRDIYQGMPTGLGVDGIFLPGGCAASIKVEQYKSFNS